MPYGIWHTSRVHRRLGIVAAAAAVLLLAGAGRSGVRAPREAAVAAPTAHPAARLVAARATPPVRRAPKRIRPIEAHGTSITIPHGPLFDAHGAIGRVTGGIALTFDDGPDPRWTPQVLDLLRKYHIHATFCLIGVQVPDHAALVRRIAAEGHALCDHTWTHDEKLRTRPAAVITGEITRTAAAIRAAGGVAPRYFRAPAGNWSPALIATAGSLGLRPLGWSVDPRDWSKPGTGHILSVLHADARPGTVVLLHDGGGDRSETVAALRQVLPDLVAAHTRFVLP
jgi:peptidoglycan-N-acetylglucosamine deacetylase